MESTHFAKKNVRLKCFVVSLAIVLITLVLTVLSKEGVKTVAQKVIHTQVSVGCNVIVRTAVGTIEAHQSFIQNTLKSYKEFIRTISFNTMKTFTINCQSWKTAKCSFGNIVDNYGIDMLCLTETFENERESVTFRSKISTPRKD